MDAVFWADMLLSVALAAVSIFLGRWWGVLNHSAEAGRVIAALSLCIPIEGLTTVQKALLSRDLDFKSLSIRSNASVVMSGVVGIIMAYLGFGVWALVGQQIVRDASALALLSEVEPVAARFKFFWVHLRDLLWILCLHLHWTTRKFRRCPVCARRSRYPFWPCSSGLYKLADKFVSSVVAMATSSIQAVSLPEFSRRQNDPVELRKSALSCIRLSASATLPASGRARCGKRPAYGYSRVQTGCRLRP